MIETFSYRVRRSDSYSITRANFSSSLRGVPKGSFSISLYSAVILSFKSSEFVGGEKLRFLKSSCGRVSSLKITKSMSRQALL